MSEDSEREKNEQGYWWAKIPWRLVRRVPKHVYMLQHQDNKNNVVFEEEIKNLFADDCREKMEIHQDTNVPRHVRQQETWDCGIACMEMAMQWLEINDLDRNDVIRLADTQSIWTMDLVWILQDICQRKEPHCTFRYLFCSQRLEASDELAHMNYYRAAFQADKSRVSQRFREARQMKACMLEISLTMAQFLRMIRKSRCIAIALVDMTILRGANDLNAPTTAQHDKVKTYIGHYVLVSGISDDPEAVQQAKLNDHDLLSASQECHYRPESEVLVVHDPGVDQSMSYYSFHHFEQAWKAHGTDQDVIFIFNHG